MQNVARLFLAVLRFKIKSMLTHYFFNTFIILRCNVIFSRQQNIYYREVTLHFHYDVIMREGPQ